MRRSLSSILSFTTFLSLSPASIAQPSYDTGTLVGIERKIKVTPFTYVFEVVVSYYETVTYELQI